jgi:hypothetical protein
MVAPSGNTFTTVGSNDRLVRDLHDLLATIERIAARQDASWVGYSNTAIANTLAWMTYSNTGNGGHPSARFASAGFTYNACTTIQGLTSCLNTVLTANT